MTSQPLVQYASRTDVGMRRAGNQDSLAIRLCREQEEWQTCGHLFAVADGMGGHSVGDLASRIAAEALPQAYHKCDADSIPERLSLAIRASNQAIHDKARENPEFADMGTTCSALVLSPQGAYAGNVGDSRVYRIRNHQTEQLTFDHSLQWEMIRQGRATMDNVDGLHPRNVITRCLGPDPAVEVDVEGPFPIAPGDRFVICSDGLTGHVTDEEIGAITSELKPQQASRLLVDLANCRGGADNVTVIVVHVENIAQAPGAAVAKMPQVPVVKKSPATRRLYWRSLLSKLSLWLFLVMALAGLGALVFKRMALGMWLICPAVVIGFLRIVLLTGTSTAEEDAGETGSRSRMRRTAIQETNCPAAESPYRTTTAELTDALLAFLATAQSELTQAARDNGWKSDFSALEGLDRRAVAAERENQRGECLKLRAESIDALMKELYASSRRS